MLLMVPSEAQAAVFVAPNHELEVRKFPVVAAPDGGAIVRVLCCTICRSDLHTWRGRRSGPTPAILGHEIVGEVAALGRGLTHDILNQPIGVGDRVTWTLHSCCGRCYYCAVEQLPMKCQSLKKYGHDSCELSPYLQGGFAEYCVIDSGTRVVKLPAGLPTVVAAPANCGVATAVAACDAAGLRHSESVLILGAGALGCYAAAVARHAGCRNVIASDVVPERLQFIRRCGATDTIDAAQLDGGEFVQRARRLTGGLGVDCALEVAGVPATIEPALHALRKGGRLIEVGCCFPGARVSLDVSIVLSNLLSIRGVHNYDARHLSEAVRFLAENLDAVPFREIVGAEVPFSEINRAIRLAEAGEVMRVAVTF